MKIIAASIFAFLFEKIFPVQEGLLKLSTLTPPTVQALCSHQAILTTNLTVEILKIRAYVHGPGCHCSRHITRDHPFPEEPVI